MACIMRCSTVPLYLSENWQGEAELNSYTFQWPIHKVAVIGAGGRSVHLSNRSMSVDLSPKRRHRSLSISSTENEGTGLPRRSIDNRLFLSYIDFNTGTNNGKKEIMHINCINTS